MKTLILFVIVLLKSRVFVTRPVNTTLVGVTDEKLNDLIWRALEGFREIILDGDDELNIDPLEPYKINDNLLWYYDDRIGKNRIYVDCVGPCFLHGLSTYMVEEVSASVADLDVKIKLNFNLLQSKGKYKAGGYLFKNIVPIYGSGPFDATSYNIDVKIWLNMTMIDSYLFVEETSVSLKMDHFTVKAANIFEIPSAFTNTLFNDILRRMNKKYKKTVDDEINDVLLELADDTFSGMSLKELFDLLKYLAEKTMDSKSTLQHMTAEQEELRKYLR